MQFSNFQDTGKKTLKGQGCQIVQWDKSLLFRFLKIQNLLKSTIWERPLALVMKDFLF